jgi:hypothetical protein
VKDLELPQGRRRADIFPESGKKRSWQAVDLQPNIQMFVAVTVDKEKLALNAYDVKNNLIDSLILKK